MRIFLVCGLLSIAVATDALALGDLENLKGKIIAYAGEFESVDCPISGKYDCSAWPITMLKTRRGPEICFGSDKYVRCNYRCSGLIGVGEDKVTKVYVLDAIGDATEISFHQYRCPSLF